MLRANWGSRPEILDVYAYDPAVGNALVRWKRTDGTLLLGETRLAELEALGTSGKLLDVDVVLRSMAGVILPGGAPAVTAIDGKYGCV